MFGLLMLAAGLAVLGLVAWDNVEVLPFPMPRFWRSQRTVCLALAFLSIVFGLFVIARGPRESEMSAYDRRWQPTKPGRRFHSVVLYTRTGCHLCDEVLELLRRYAQFLPPILESNIDADPQLRERFDNWVPVVEIDGRIRFKGRMSEILLRRLIEGTPP